MPEGFAFGAGSAQGHTPLLERALGSVDRGAALVPLSSDLRNHLIGELHALHIDAVVTTTAAESALIADLLGRAPQRVAGVDVWWSVA
jgi:hypothetical protein